MQGVLCSSKKKLIWDFQTTACIEHAFEEILIQKGYIKIISMWTSVIKSYLKIKLR